VKIDGGIELEKAEHIRFRSVNRFGAWNEGLNCADRLLVDSAPYFSYFQICHQPHEIDLSMLSPGHKPITLHIVEAISVNLA
jgi:hypothetical protein